MCVTPAWTVTQTVDFLLPGVRAFASASQVHEFLVSGTCSGDGWIKSGVISGLDVDYWSHLAVGLTKSFVWTFICMCYPYVLSIPVTGSLHRTVVNDAVFLFAMGMPSHKHPSGT